MQWSNCLQCAHALATALALVQGAHSAEPIIATTRQEEFVRVYHGIPVQDPYAWLEDGNNPDVNTWSNAQNEAARTYLDNLPEWSPVARRLTELAKRKAKTYTDFQYSGGHGFFVFLDPSEQQNPVLCVIDGIDLSTQRTLVGRGSAGPRRNRLVCAIAGRRACRREPIPRWNGGRHAPCLRCVNRT